MHDLSTAFIHTTARSTNHPINQSIESLLAIERMQSYPILRVSSSGAMHRSFENNCTFPVTTALNVRASPLNDCNRSEFTLSQFTTVDVNLIGSMPSFIVMLRSHDRILAIVSALQNPRRNSRNSLTHTTNSTPVRNANQFSRM